MCFFLSNLVLCVRRRVSLQLGMAGAQRVDGMLRDLEASAAVNKAFLTHVFSSKGGAALSREVRARLFDTSYGEGGPFFQVMVISVGRFPPATVDKGPLALPQHVAQLLDAFQSFYISEGRALSTVSLSAAM